MWPFRSTMLAAFCVFASGSAWSQLVLNTATTPMPDEAFEIFVTAAYPSPGTFSPEIIVGDDGVTITVDLHVTCITSCPTPPPSTKTFAMSPLPAGSYTMTVYLNRCCRPESGQLQLVIGEPPVSTVSYEGLWLNPDESGWGLYLTHQRTILSGTWFTYDRDGSGMWLMVSPASQDRSGNFTGALYRTRGPAFNAVPFTPIGLADYTLAGTLTLSFTDANTGTMSYTLDGVTQTKAITRYIYASGGTDCMLGTAQEDLPPNYTDLWVDGSETGWGVNLTHQGDILFATWFTYQANGKGQWLVMSNGVKTSLGIYTGALQRTTGPAFSAVPFDPKLVKRTTVGSATFAFTDGNNGTFSYTLDGISQIKPIARYLLLDPPTVCQ